MVQHFLFLYEIGRKSSDQKKLYNKGRSPSNGKLSDFSFYMLIAKNLLTGSLKNRSIGNLETQKKSISMKNSQFFDYLLYAKSK